MHDSNITGTEKSGAARGLASGLGWKLMFALTVVVFVLQGLPFVAAENAFIALEDHHPVDVSGHDVGARGIEATHARARPDAVSLGGWQDSNSTLRVSFRNPFATLMAWVFGEVSVIPPAVPVATGGVEPMPSGSAPTPYSSGGSVAARGKNPECGRDGECRDCDPNGCTAKRFVFYTSAASRLQARSWLETLKKLGGGLAAMAKGKGSSHRKRTGVEDEAGAGKLDVGRHAEAAAKD